MTATWAVTAAIESDMNASSSAPALEHRPRQRAQLQRISLRLPIRLAARLAALCEMHKQKSRTEILTDLITLGLSQVEKAVAPRSGLDQATPPSALTPVYLLSGPFAEFHHLVVKHHRRMERELAGDDLELPAAPDPYDLNEDET